MITKIKENIKKHLPDMPYFDSVMSAECIQAVQRELLFSDYDLEGFQLHNPVVLIEDDLSVQAFIDKKPYQKGINKHRYFFEAIAPDEITFSIVFGQILSITFTKEHKYASICTLDSMFTIKGDMKEILDNKALKERIPADLIQKIGNNAINGLKLLMDHYS